MITSDKPASDVRALSEARSNPCPKANTRLGLGSGTAKGRSTAKLAALGVASLLAVAACGSSSSSQSSSTTAAPAVTSGASASTQAPAQNVSMTFTLDFLTDGAHAPVYVANSKGYFSSSGLHVTIQPTHGSQDSITDVATGKSQMGLTDAGTLIKAIASQHVPVTAVGISLQTEPFSIVTLKSSGISTPSQLAGKTIGLAPATSDASFLPAFLSKVGLSSSQVHEVSLTPPELVPSLLDGKVAAVDEYGQVFAKYSSQVNIVPWSKYGINPLGTVYIANNSFLAAHPAAVKSFLAAAYKGLAYTEANPSSAAAIVAAADPGSAASYFDSEFAILKPYWATKSSAGTYGHMTAADWTATQALNIKYSIQTTSVPISQVYSNSYLP